MLLTLIKGESIMDTEKQGNIPVATNKETTKSMWPSIHGFTDIEQAFDRFFGRRLPSLLQSKETPLLDNLFEFDRQRLPSLDVIDRDNEVLVRAEIPGIEKKDINISLTDNLLTIKGHSHNEKKEEKGDYFRHEISSSSFARSVMVPSSVDASKTTASLKDGVLEISLAKIESSQRRSIKIQ
jgi:HSP20 family protein